MKVILFQVNMLEFMHAQYYLHFYFDFQKKTVELDLLNLLLLPLFKWNLKIWGSGSSEKDKLWNGTCQIRIDCMQGTGIGKKQMKFLAKGSWL